MIDSITLDSGENATTRNPRYLAYCVASGATSVAEMQRRDGEAYPGGKMTGFMFWIGRQWEEYDRVFNIPAKSFGRHGEDHQRLFDAWLAEKVIHYRPAAR